MTASEITQLSFRGSPSGNLMRHLGGTFTYSANAPSMLFPIINIDLQMFSLPFLQKKQSPQVMGPMRTLSPTFTFITFAPTSSTIPDGSWPRIRGGFLKVGPP